LALRAGQTRAGRSTSAWLAHKADIGAPHVSDEAIVSQFDDITALLRGRQGGWLSPNNCREETGWPRAPGGDSIQPPVAGGRPAGDGGAGDDALASPAPSSDDKIARLDERRVQHGND
jgi:hypothetical protein